VSSVCGAYGSVSAGKGYHPVPCKKHQLILNLKSNSEFVGQQGPPPVPSRICASLCDFSRRDFGCGHGALQLVSDSGYPSHTTTQFACVYLVSPIGSSIDLSPIRSAEFSFPISASTAKRRLAAPAPSPTELISPLRVLVWGIGGSRRERFRELGLDLRRCVELLGAVRGFRRVTAASRRLSDALEPLGVTSIRVALALLPVWSPRRPPSLVLSAMEQSALRAQERWDQVANNFDLLFARVGDILGTQIKLEAQYDMTTKVVEQMMKDQQVLAQQVEITGQAVARLTLNSTRLPVGEPPSPTVSDASTDNPFHHDPQGTSHTVLPRH